MSVREQGGSSVPASSEVKGYLEICRRGETTVRRQALGGSHLIVGRNPNAQIVLDHTTVSRSHAELVYDPFGRWWVHDLRSTNGTYVNGSAVEERMLNPGDWIGIGDFTLRLHMPAARAPMDSIYPLPNQLRPEASEADREDDEDATLITVLPKTTQSPHVSVSHLSTVMALGRRLMRIEDAAVRLRTLCEFAVGDGFPAESATVVRSREDTNPKIISGPFYRDPAKRSNHPHFSRSVFSTLWKTHEPVLASNAPYLSGGIRRLSSAGIMAPLAVVACPLDFEDGKMNALYVEFPPNYGTVEWLTLVALAADTYLQAELVWEVRRHVEAHASVERELEMARQIQEGLVPRSFRFEGLEIAIGFEPCRWVGGDYVDAVPMPDGRVLLAVADVCGKGLQAALVASSIHTMVRATVDAGGTVPQLMDRLNKYLCSYLPDHSFVTMICIAVNASTGVIECINAGHPPAFVVRPDGSLRQLQSEVNVSLGMMPTEMVVQRSWLVAGEVLVLYTDGLTEVVDEDQQPMGVEKFGTNVSEIVLANPNASVDDMRARLAQMLHKYRGSQLATDDSTFLVARRPRPGRPRQSSTPDQR